MMGSPLGEQGGRVVFAVIPGRAKHEPGIHLTAPLVGQWIPGSRQEARPGMTAEQSNTVGWWARRKRAFARPTLPPTPPRSGAARVAD
jgi:hypothetical protein